MKFSIFFSVVASLLLAGQCAANSLEELAAALPKCGLACTIEGIGLSGCGLNATCMCGSEVMSTHVTACLQESCSVREALTSAKLFGGGCKRPVRDSGMGLIWGPFITAAIALIAVCLRMYIRTRNGIKDIGPDDWVILFTMVVGIPFNLLGIVLKDNGLGKDFWEVPFDNITKMLMVFYIDEQLYFFILTLTKISILLFFLRVFPDQKFRRWVFIMIGVNIVWGIVANAMTIFQCWPVSHFWNRWDGTFEGRCNAANVQAYVTSLMSMALDIAIMALPFPQLLKLHMSLKKKLHIMVMFAVGIFVVVVAAVRLRTLEQFSTSTNPTWDNVPSAYWSAIEANTGIICACLPACRSMFSRFYTKAKEFTYASKSSKLSSKQSTAKSAEESKAMRLKTLQFKDTGAQGTFYELNNYDSQPAGLQTMDEENGRARKPASEYGSVDMIIQGNEPARGTRDNDSWQDEKNEPTVIIHGV